MNLSDPKFLYNILRRRLQMVPMITEISPIFGLSLLGLVETTVLSVIVGAIVGIGSSVIIAYTIHKRNKELLEQQKKVNSAQLALKLLESWNKTNVLMQMLLKMEKPNVKFTDENDVHYMLAPFEDIAVLRKDGTLTETHVREFFGRDIVRINANKSIMKILNEYHKEDPIHNYNNLKKTAR